MVARVLLSTVFVVGGARSMAKPAAFVPRAQKVTDRVGPVLEKTPLPAEAETLVRINGAVQVVAGLMLATGRFPRPAALALAGSLLPTTLAGHPFWTVEDPVERRHHQVHFMKNLGLVGGLLLAAGDTGGRPGLAWAASHYAGHGRHALDHARHNLEHGMHNVGHGQQSIGRAVRTARREAKLAYKAAAVGHRLPHRS